jgi:hypothetical protein
MHIHIAILKSGSPATSAGSPLAPDCLGSLACVLPGLHAPHRCRPAQCSAIPVPLHVSYCVCTPLLCAWSNGQWHASNGNWEGLCDIEKAHPHFSAHLACMQVFGLPGLPATFQAVFLAIFIACDTYFALTVVGLSLCRSILRVGTTM